MPDIIFYSWQSDLPNSTNRGFIQTALENAIDAVKQIDDFKLDPVLDRDTQGVAGSPDIGQTIFSKIDAASAVVCDISIINRGSKERPAPNPNVLIELGYSLKAHGPGKLILVMNVGFGGPELLPFDLKQKRVVTYQAEPDDAQKAENKKILTKKLEGALRAILEEHAKVRAAVQATPSPVDTAIQSIEEDRRDQARSVSGFMSWLAEELTKLDQHSFAAERDENLIQALEASIPLVKEFDRVASQVAAVGSETAGQALFKAFEQIATLCYWSGKSGSFRDSDFDLFRFVVNEMLLILVAYLIKDQRWELIDFIVEEPLHVSNAPGGIITFPHLSGYVVLLDEIRNKRLGLRKVSLHADTLKIGKRGQPELRNFLCQDSDCSLREKQLGSGCPLFSSPFFQHLPVPGFIRTLPKMEPD